MAMDIRVILLITIEALFAYVLLVHAGLLNSIGRMAAAVALLLIAFGARVFVLGYETADYQGFLTLWVEYYRSSGGFSGLSGSIGNYNIPYLYFLALFSYSSIRDLYLIKLLSIFFDVVLAYSVSRLVLLSGKSERTAFFAFFAVLFWPTVFLNGAVWGQCDSIYVSLGVLAIYLAMSDRPCLSLLTLSLSFGFKLQAVFIMPVFAALLFRGSIRWKHLPLFPLGYVLLVLPAVLLGRPFLETLTLYFSQTGSIGSGLNYNSPSLFAFFDHTQGLDVALLSKIGIIAAFGFMLLILALCFVFRKRLSDRAVLIAAALLALGIPLLLPHMHDRYFFAADLLVLLLAFLDAPLWPAALAVESASLLGYHAYLKMRYLLPMRDGAVLNLIALVILIAAFVFEIRKRNPSQDSIKKAETD